MHEGQGPSLVVAFKGADVRQVFADHEGLRQPLRRAFEFVLFKQELESQHAFAHVANDFICERIDRAHRRGKAAGLGKKVLGILSRSRSWLSPSAKMLR